MNSCQLPTHPNFLGRLAGGVSKERGARSRLALAAALVLLFPRPAAWWWAHRAGLLDQLAMWGK